MPVINAKGYRLMSISLQEDGYRVTVSPSCDEENSLRERTGYCPIATLVEIGESPFLGGYRLTELIGKVMEYQDQPKAAEIIIALMALGKDPDEAIDLAPDEFDV